MVFWICPKLGYAANPGEFTSTGQTSQLKGDFKLLMPQNMSLTKSPLRSHCGACRVTEGADEDGDNRISHQEFARLLSRCHDVFLIHKSMDLPKNGWIYADVWLFSWGKTYDIITMEFVGCVFFHPASTWWGTWNHQIHKWARIRSFHKAVVNRADWRLRRVHQTDEHHSVAAVTKSSLMLVKYKCWSLITQILQL